MLSNSFRRACVALAVFGLTAACQDEPQTLRSDAVTQSPFGVTPDGQQVSLYTFSNPSGMEARVIDYGGIIVSLRVPDSAGQLDDVVLGFVVADPDDACTPSWGGAYTLDEAATGLDLDRRIARYRERGGQEEQVGCSLGAGPALTCRSDHLPEGVVGAGDRGPLR